jgi:glycosyltransferase involved in cell wall biosynthesis
MKSKMLNIVPLLSGSGIRIKIIEALALKKPVIATSIAAQGIPYTKDENILIADSTDEFIEQLNKCANHGDYLISLGTNARQLAEKEYDNSHLIQKLVAFYSSLCTP